MQTASSWLARLGLDRQELRAWAMYDWANSAFMTTIIAAVFPVYYAQVAASGIDPNVATFRFSIATTIALTIVALSAPVLGIMADFAAMKKRLLFIFQAIGLVATAAMYFIYEGQWLWALLLFVVGNIGVSGAFTFYDSLLPHIAQPGELDRVSSAGYALGYTGGGLLLALNLAWISSPQTFGLADAGQATRLSFLSVAIWWGLFSIPLFRHVPEPAVEHRGPAPTGMALVTTAFSQLLETLRDLARFRQAFLMLIAFLIYNDGINTIIRMASIYGAQLGIGQGDLILALLLVQFVGIPFAFAFGRLAAVVGAKRSIFLALAVYAGISVLGYFMKTAAHFYLLAVLVGMVQGGSQALSRSLFASMIPKQKSSAFFAFFAVFEKFAGIIGPAIFAAAIGATGSSQNAILSVIIFFVVGALILARVDVAEGQRLAREAESAA
ncbi:MAG: MFS transporter [Acidobacteria bacterium]|nr:MFS transporter [Acidobacteriota bacterium]